MCLASALVNLIYNAFHNRDGRHPQSVSARASAAARAAQPLFDLAFNPEAIKLRFAAVPVYAVVNNKNEFVLVTGEASSRPARIRQQSATLPCCRRHAALRPVPCHLQRPSPVPPHPLQTDAKQLGLFFFSEAEAQAMLKTVRAALKLPTGPHGAASVASLAEPTRQPAPCRASFIRLAAPATPAPPLPDQGEQPQAGAAGARAAHLHGPGVRVCLDAARADGH